MAAKLGSRSFSSLTASFCSPLPSKNFSKLTLFRRRYNHQRHDVLQLENAKVKFFHFVHGVQKPRKMFLQRQKAVFAMSEDSEDREQVQYIEVDPGILEKVTHEIISTDMPRPEGSLTPIGASNGKPGFVSFYNRSPKDKYKMVSEVQRNQSSLLWFIGPAVLVSSFIFPALYLRRIVSTIFEDSLLTDFLILFFTEALFYCGVAVFLLLIDRLRRPSDQDSSSKDSTSQPSQLGHRISSVTTLVLSLVIPMVTMGLVWPWTGPAASATLAPYLVGIVIQFAFEQYAKYRKSPSWPAIPIIFQVYRLHQLNRAAQLVTALSFTVRGADATAHNLAINKSLGTLLNVLQVLGIICIWSLSSFLMRFSPSASTPYNNT